MGFPFRDTKIILYTENMIEFDVFDVIEKVRPYLCNNLKIL